VAVKVLPAALTKDHDRVARFRREAQVLATFNHPNIASIHGFEEAEEGVALALCRVRARVLPTNSPRLVLAEGHRHGRWLRANRLRALGPRLCPTEMP
jgi:serine/threonine protein kinase